MGFCDLHIPFKTILAICVIGTIATLINASVNDTMTNWYIFMGVAGVAVLDGLALVICNS